MESSGVIYPIGVLLLLLTLGLFARLLVKAGFSPWWALLGLVPLINLAMLWVFAYSRWPRYPDR
jgi:uncharacterized membrane protein YhaH (DUF805 family)